MTGRNQQCLLLPRVWVMMMSGHDKVIAMMSKW